jgi:hypothetical protein
MNKQVHAETRAHARELQRLALWYSEHGEDRISRDLQTAALRVTKLRPAKESQLSIPLQPSPASPAESKPAARGKAG